MPAKPIPLHHVKRDMKRYFDRQTASALFDEFVAEIYDCEDLSTDDYSELRKKLKKYPRSAALLIRLKQV